MSGVDRRLEPACSTRSRRSYWQSEGPGLIGCGVHRRDRRYRPLPDRLAARAAGRVRPDPRVLGNSDRYRLDPGGNRQLNSAFYLLAIIGIRDDSRTAVYLPNNAPTVKPTVTRSAASNATSSTASPSPSETPKHPNRSACVGGSRRGRHVMTEPDELQLPLWAAGQLKQQPRRRGRGGDQAAFVRQRVSLDFVEGRRRWACGPTGDAMVTSGKVGFSMPRCSVGVGAHFSGV
jgi:hypothetical protein